MKIGFTIGLGSNDEMHVTSSEHETWEDALAEVFSYLQRVKEPRVQTFVRWYLNVRINEDGGET